MAQQANITVFDGATTPVTHSIKTDGVRQEGATAFALWKESVGTVPDYAQIRLTQVRQKLRSGAVKVTSRVEVPVMESVSGQNAAGYTAAPKVAYTERHEYVTYKHQRSTPYQSQVAAQMLLNWMGNVSTSVAAVNTGIVADLHQNLLMVS